MWLVEDKNKEVSGIRELNRKIVKDEINKILNGFSVDISDKKISFTEKGVRVNGKLVETNTGPNRTYLDGNPFEVCICICDSKRPQSASSIKGEDAVKLAKEIKHEASSIKGPDFVHTCDNINKRLENEGYKLVVLYVEKEWIDKNKTSKNKNYTTIITYLLNGGKTEEGCWVLNGL